LGARAYLLAALIGLVLVAGGVISFAFVSDYLEERGQSGSAAITVGDRTYSIGYFADRLASPTLQIINLDPGQAISIVADQIVEEEAVRRFAPEVGVSIDPEEVDGELATALGLERDDPGFAAAYEAERARSGLNDQEFRQVVTAQLLARKIRDKLGESIPPEVEQVLYLRILLGTEEEARQVVARLQSGEDFSTVAQEVSLDTATKDKGGEAGWLASGANALLEDTLFSLEPGAISEPFPVEGSGFFVFEVLEKASRPPDEDQKAQIRGQAYQSWLADKQQTLPVINHVINDPEKLQWVLERAFGG
jgi:parvulin-like peptidyl-prolyl isomerase